MQGLTEGTVYVTVQLLKFLRIAVVLCPNNSARFKVRTIAVLFGWRYRNFNICHLPFLQLVVMGRYTKEQRVIIVKHLLQNAPFVVGLASSSESSVMIIKLLGVMSQATFNVIS